MASDSAIQSEYKLLFNPSASADGSIWLILPKLSNWARLMLYGDQESPDWKKSVQLKNMYMYRKDRENKLSWTDSPSELTSRILLYRHVTSRIFTFTTRFCFVKLGASYSPSFPLKPANLASLYIYTALYIVRAGNIFSHLDVVRVSYIRWLATLFPPFLMSKTSWQFCEM